MVEVRRRQNGSIDAVAATKPNGDKTTIHGRGGASIADLFMSVFAFGGDPREIVTVQSVFNIKGAKDGANSLVICNVSGDKKLKARLVETPEMLRTAFIDADLAKEFPDIQETRWCRVYKSLFGADYYSPVSE